MKILGIDNNSKTVKGLKQNISTAIIYLAPSNASGVTNTCPSASKQCREACLFTAGRGRMSLIQEARINKTKFLVNDEETFLRQLWKETAAHEKRCNKNDLFAAERLNGTSDLAWEDYHLDGQNIFEAHPNIQFYDYTKRMDRAVKFANGLYPKTTIWHSRAAKHQRLNGARSSQTWRERGNGLLEGITRRRFRRLPRYQWRRKRCSLPWSDWRGGGSQVQANKGRQSCRNGFHTQKQKPYIKMKKKDKNDIDNNPIHIRNNSDSNSNHEERYEKWEIT